MLTLVVTVALGLAFSLFATQNTAPVSISFGYYYIPNVPLYLVILVPLMIGLVASFFIHISSDLISKLTLSEKGDEIKNLRKENAELNKQVHKLELENTKMKAKNGDDDFDEDSF